MTANLWWVSSAWAREVDPLISAPTAEEAVKAFANGDEILAATVEAVAFTPNDVWVLQRLIAHLREKLAEREKFKAYVHQRLDEAGVPADPPSPHREQGCRIGGRLDWVFAQLAEVREREKKTEQAVESLTECLDSWGHDEHCARRQSRRRIADPGNAPCDCNIEEAFAIRAAVRARSVDATGVGDGATHRCKSCGARWRFRTPDPRGATKLDREGYWNLRSPSCGKCCDVVPMGDQIEPLAPESLRAALSSPASEGVEAKKPVCERCDDTHQVETEVHGTLMCTSCPSPCARCRAGGNGPYCETTPCPCACHRSGVEREDVPATHRCRVCGALWRENKHPARGHGLADSATASWTLVSAECGPCCDNVAMSIQIECVPCDLCGEPASVTNGGYYCARHGAARTLTVYTPAPTDGGGKR